jgi:Mrp family chromosome partitioning ATPase
MEEHSGLRFVPSAPTDLAWTSRGLQRFYQLIDYLKERFAVVIIDLPPIVGLAETIRLAKAADNIALVIRWGRTERQFVQFALDTLRTARISTIAVILNDIDLKAQRRRGYRDHSVVYASKELYRVTPGDREPAILPMAATEPDAHSGPGRQSEPRPGDSRRDQPRPAASDIEKLYNRHYD